MWFFFLLVLSFSLSVVFPMLLCMNHVYSISLLLVSSSVILGISLSPFSFYKVFYLYKSFLICIFKSDSTVTDAMIVNAGRHDDKINDQFSCIWTMNFWSCHVSVEASNWTGPLWCRNKLPNYFFWLVFCLFFFW